MDLNLIRIAHKQKEQAKEKARMETAEHNECSFCFPSFFGLCFSLLFAITELVPYAVVVSTTNVDMNAREPALDQNVL
jgi:hypothetical protein